MPDTEKWCGVATRLIPTQSILSFSSLSHPHSLRSFCRLLSLMFHDASPSFIKVIFCLFLYFRDCVSSSCSCVLCCVMRILFVSMHVCLYVCMHRCVYVCTYLRVYVSIYVLYILFFNTIIWSPLGWCLYIYIYIYI
jgi:hypothetical protein